MSTQAVVRSMLVWHWRKARRMLHALMPGPVRVAEPEAHAPGVRWG